MREGSTQLVGQHSRGEVSLRSSDPKDRPRVICASISSPPPPLFGHDTNGIQTHIHDLQQLFVHAPDTRIDLHPIRIGSGEWTAVTGVMTGTFTQPMR
jgi:hypothetical protein